MASLIKERQNGRDIWRIAYYDKDGARRKIRLGELNKRAAQIIATRVQQLADFVYAGLSPDAELTAWLNKIGKELLGKLVASGLITIADGRELPPPAPKAIGLAGFLDAYIAGRCDVKENTATNFKQARGYLVEHFGADRALDAITAGDADEFRVWLKGKLSDNTVRRHCGRCKQFFRAAVRKQLIAENPFADIKDCRVRANRERDHFVSRADTQKVLKACPDTEWRLIFALARFGGLRVPSELLALRWSDVNWELRRVTIRSPKTEHHEGRESRIIPLFPELAPTLEAAWSEAPEGAEFVIGRYRGENVNLRTRLELIVARAGIESWPKLFQNLRASRATELAAEYPAHVAAAWLGHSRIVAHEHYWRVTDADFDRATGGLSVRSDGQGGGARVAK